MYCCRSKEDKPVEPLLKIMNRNIATLTRIRRIHSKFLTLNATDSTGLSGAPPLPEPLPDNEVDDEAIVNEKGWQVRGETDESQAEDCLNWMTSKILHHAGFQGQSERAIGLIYT